MVIITDEPDLFTACPLCFEPLVGEKFFHLECAKRESIAADEDPDADIPF